jgi:3-phytase
MSRLPSLAARAALVVLFVAPTAHASRQDEPLTIAVIGDTPYGQAQVDDLPGLAGSINGDPDVSLVVHVGDIKTGSSRCDDSYFSTVRGLFDRFEDPFLYTPGDNEWTDCHRKAAGKYDPVERLIRLRQVFYPVPGESLGLHKRRVSTQARVAGFEPFVENTLWTDDRVVFSLVHVVGSNNDLLPWFADDLTDDLVDDPARRQAEFQSRNDAALDWIDRTFARARRDDAPAVVVFMQADMWVGPPIDGFNAIAQRLADRSAAFGRPVLLVQGDSHRFLVDRPFAQGDPTHGVTTAAPNVTRIVVEGETSSEWLRLTVDRRRPEVFSWQRVFRTPRPVLATAETPPLFDDEEGGDADADDPAIWVHRSTPEASLILATKKNAGLSVYDLAGRELQAIHPPAAPGEEDAAGRFNNVDLLTGFSLRGRKVDLAVVTDRGRDQLRFYAIDPDAARRGQPPLSDVTAADVPFVFSATQAEVNEQTTAYGLAVTSLDHGRGALAFVSQRSRTRVASLYLIPRRDGKVSYARYDVFTLPNVFTLPDGQRWTACQDDDGQESQVEGMVVDHKEQVLYLAQEQIGVWRLPLFRLGARPDLFEKVRGFGVPYDRTFDPEEEEYVCTPRPAEDPGFGGKNLSADAEGLTIAYGGTRDDGYLIASSQGDSTFSVFRRTGDNRLVGRFTVADGPATDGAQSCDGAAVTTVPLGPRFPNGLLVVHDGDNTPDVLDVEGEVRANTNFKLVPWPDLAKALDLKLAPPRW